MRNVSIRAALLGDRRLPPAAWLLPLLVAVPTALCLLVPFPPFEQIGHGFLDLEVYRIGFETWRAGGDLYGELPKTASNISLPFIYPPFAALALGIFAVLPWTAATIAYLFCSIGAVAVTLFVVAGHVWPQHSPRRRALLAGAVATPLGLLLEPTLATLDFGQVNLFLMVLVAVDCLAKAPKWPRGLLLGLAAAIKLTPAAFVLYFLVKRDYRAAVTAGISGAVATAIGFVALPDESRTYWFGGFGNVDGLSGSAFRTNQSIQGVLARLEVSETASTVLWLGLSAALVAVAVLAMRHAGTSPPIALSINALVALLVSPISWSHHWVWAAPALLAIIGYATRLPWREAVGWYAAATTCAALFYAAPHRFVPGEDERELTWTPIQHVIGNGYVWVSFVLLAALLVTMSRRSSVAGAQTDGMPARPTGSNGVGPIIPTTDPPPVEPVPAPSPVPSAAPD